MARIPSWIAQESIGITAKENDMAIELELAREKEDLADMVNSGEDLNTDYENLSNLKRMVSVSSYLPTAAEEIVTIAAESYCSRWAVESFTDNARTGYGSKTGLLVALESAEKSLWRRILDWLKETYERIKSFIAKLFGRNKEAKEEVKKAVDVIKATPQAAVDTKRIAVIKPQPIYKARKEPLKTEEEVTKSVDQHTLSPEEQKKRDVKVVKLKEVMSSIGKGSYDAAMGFNSLITEHLFVGHLLKNGAKSKNEFKGYFDNFDEMLSQLQNASRSFSLYEDGDAKNFVAKYTSDRKNSYKVAGVAINGNAVGISQHTEYSLPDFDTYERRTPLALEAEVSKETMYMVQKALGILRSTIEDVNNSTKEVLEATKEGAENLDDSKFAKLFEHVTTEKSELDNYNRILSAAARKASINVIKLSKMYNTIAEQYINALNGVLSTVA